MNATNGFSIFCLIAMTTACSSIKSISNPDPENLDGLVYYMPSKDFFVTVTTGADNKPEKVEIKESLAYADTSQRFVLHHQNNLLGKNELSVGLGVNGLLQTTKSTTTSGVSEAFQNLATSAAYIYSIAPTTQCTKGTHTTIVAPSAANTPFDFCDINITLIPRSNVPQTGSKKFVANSSKKEESGVFYRQNIPYQLTTSSNDKSINITQLVSSPSASPIYFMPVSGTVFSNNMANFAFTDGVPTTYEQTTEGELIALAKLPADVIGAYFGAVGKVFDSFSSNDKKEATALTDEYNLAVEKQKFKLCMNALKSGKTTAELNDLGCES